MKLFRRCIGIMLLMIVFMVGIFLVPELIDIASTVQSEQSGAGSVATKFYPTIDTSDLEYIGSIMRPTDSYDAVINVTGIELEDWIDHYRDADGVKYTIERDSQALYQINYLESEQIPPENASLEALQKTAVERLTELGFSMEDYTLVYAAPSTYGTVEFEWEENIHESINSVLMVSFKEDGRPISFAFAAGDFSDIAEVDEERCRVLLDEYLNSRADEMEKSNEKITSMEISYRRLCGYTLASVGMVVTKYDETTGRKLYDDPRIVVIYY